MLCHLNSYKSLFDQPANAWFCNRRFVRSCFGWQFQLQPTKILRLLNQFHQEWADARWLLFPIPSWTMNRYILAVMISNTIMEHRPYINIQHHHYGIITHDHTIMKHQPQTRSWITTQPSGGGGAQVLAENVLESGVVATGLRNGLWKLDQVSRIESCKMYKLVTSGVAISVTVLRL